MAALVAFHLDERGVGGNRVQRLHDLLGRVRRMLRFVNTRLGDTVEFPGLTVFMAQSRNGPVLLFDRPPATTYARGHKQRVCGQLGGWT